MKLFRLFNHFFQRALFMKRLRAGAFRMRLTDAERIQGKKELLDFMEAHPLPRPIPLPRFTLASIITPQFFPKLVPVTLLLLVFLGSTGVLAAEAEKAFPGDALYLVKTRINEPLKKAIAFSASAKAKMEATLATRRLEEAEFLAAKDALSPAIADDLRTAFNTHANAFIETTTKQHNTKDTQALFDIHSNFEAQLRAHTTVLTLLRDRASSADADDTLKIFVEKIKENTQTITLQREENEKVAQKNTAKTVGKIARGKRIVAEKKVRDVTALIERSKQTLGVDRVENATTDLNHAKAIIVEGEKKQTQGEDAEAFELFERAERVAKEREVVTDAQMKLGITETQKDKSTNSSVVVAVATDAHIYHLGDSIRITVSARNTLDSEQTLAFPTSCQATYALNEEVLSPAICTQALTYVTISARATHTWSFVHTAPLVPGDYRITGSVVGYGASDARITILPNDSRPEQIVPLAPSEKQPTIILPTLLPKSLRE